MILKSRLDNGNHNSCYGVSKLMFSVDAFKFVVQALLCLLWNNGVRFSLDDDCGC